MASAAARHCPVVLREDFVAERSLGHTGCTTVGIAGPAKEVVLAKDPGSVADSVRMRVADLGPALV